MKNIIWFIVFMAVFLPACENDTTNAEKESEKDMAQEQTENDKGEQEETEDQTGTGEKESADEEKQQEQNQSEEEPVETLYQIDSETSSVVPVNEDAPEKAVLLTIDDAPDKHALEMAGTLKELDANAIFFVNGHFLETQEDKEALKQLHEMGFEIGNHTNNHPLLPDLPTEEQEKEIVNLNDKVEDIIGERPKFFRAPNGANTDFTKNLVKDEGMVLMNWTYGYDYFEPYMDADKLAEAMVSGKGPEVDVDYSLLKPGANLLMHDREWTMKALEDIVTGLRDKGYKIVDPKTIKTIDETNE